MTAPRDRRLDDLRIASPCTADWDAMSGDERTRFCQQCQLHVHDLSAMTRHEALAVLDAAGGRDGGSRRLCVRFHRRADGTVLTRDCPVGLRQRARRMWARAVALVGMMWGCAACLRPSGGQEPDPLMGDLQMPTAPEQPGEPRHPVAPQQPPAPEQPTPPAPTPVDVRMGRVVTHPRPSEVVMGFLVPPVGSPPARPGGADAGAEGRAAGRGADGADGADAAGGPPAGESRAR